MAECTINENETDFALVLDHFQEWLNHHCVRHVRNRIAALQAVLVRRAGPYLTLEYKIVASEFIERRRRKFWRRCVEPECRNQFGAFGLHFLEIGLAAVPAHECGAVEQCRNCADPFQSGEEFIDTVPVVPGSSDDGRVE